MGIADPDAQAGGPSRPWSMGMGLVLLGLMVAMISNAYAIQNKQDPSIRPYTNTFYALGLLVSGWGVHKLLWFRPSTRPAFLRVLLTAVVTVPVFVLSGILISFIFLMMFYRFG
jgi:hypothetical protein